MPAPIQLLQLSKRYRSGFLIREIRALESVSMEVNQGEIFGFLGPNGAGKTTAIKIMMGLVKPTRGRCLVLGANPHSIEAKRRIGFLPESPYFYEHLSAREILELTARLHGMHGVRARECVTRMLEQIGLTQAQNGRLGKFSRGMLQRVGIGQALLHDPDLVVLDEPMGGLDPIGRKEFRDIILGLRDRGKTVFFSTHILQDVEMICDRVAILVQGRLVSVGRLDEILATPTSTLELTVQGLTAEDVRQSGIPTLRMLAGEGKLLVVVQGEAEKQAMIELLAARGGTLVSLVPRSRTLEDFFMTKVRESPGGAPESSGRGNINQAEQ